MSNRRTEMRTSDKQFNQINNSILGSRETISQLNWFYGSHCTQLLHSILVFAVHLHFTFAWSPMECCDANILDTEKWIRSERCFGSYTHSQNHIESMRVIPWFPLWIVSLTTLFLFSGELITICRIVRTVPVLISAVLQPKVIRTLQVPNQSAS